MNNQVILITNTELHDAIFLKEYMGKARDKAHDALDKLCVMNAHIELIRRGDTTDYDPDDMDLVQHRSNEAYRLIVDIRGIHNTILNKLEEYKE